MTPRRTADPVVGLDTDRAADPALAGGKGASLARLRRAGFAVPGGFVVATDAYAEHLAHNGLDRLIERTLARVQFDAPDDIDARTAEIRGGIVDAPIPQQTVEAIGRAYATLGDSPFVAVRSSGTAEDLADASFAGQHDTYLDVRGEDDVVVAVRRCWASMWTPRATAYRQQRGYDHLDARLAVVVVEMVRSEVSGVIFAANPVSSRVDEYLVNATWGLGEALVSGLVTPDEYVLDRRTLAVKRSTIRSKDVRIVRRDRPGAGTTTERVPPELRDAPTLSPARLAELGRLARRLSEHNGGWPQDVEWAWAGDRLYVLQARDITGVDLSWDEDVEDHGDLPRLRDDAILSRARSDTVWTGRITPLFYSLRAETRTLVTPAIYAVWAGDMDAQRNWGGGGEAIGQLRWYKYLRGAVYYNSEVEYRNHLQLVPPRLRDAALCEWTPPSWLTDLPRRPGSWRNLLRLAVRVRLLAPAFTITRVFDSLDAQIGNIGTRAVGLDPPAIARLTDQELKRYVQHTVVMQSHWVRDIAYVFYLYAPILAAMFNWMLKMWCKPHAETLRADLITALPRKTLTMVQNETLSELAAGIRASENLLTLFKTHEGAAFFTELEQHEEGRKFLERYRAFLAEFGHRGHADRDIWYPRRCEDPAIDYRSLALLIGADGERLGHSDEDLAARRGAATRTALAAIRRTRFGSLKAAMFRRVQEFMLRFYVFRDDSRHHTDRNTFAKKRAVQEVGRRLLDRGVLERPDDFYYLSKNELFRLLDGDVSDLRVVRAKVEARRRNCDRYRVEWHPPMYIRASGEEHREAGGGDDAQVAGDGAVLKGSPMSRGEGVGKARVVASVDGLGRVQKGDILVAHGTDPGWTPAFPLLAGLVLETGGTLAHGALLSREYGIPAVQLTDAMRLIEDGATIGVNGTTGDVSLVGEPA